MLCLGRTECLGNVPTEEPGVVWCLRRHVLRECEDCISEYATEGGLSKNESDLRLIWSGAREWRDWVLVLVLVQNRALLGLLIVSSPEA